MKYLHMKKDSIINFAEFVAASIVRFGLACLLQNIMNVWVGMASFMLLMAPVVLMTIAGKLDDVPKEEHKMVLIIAIPIIAIVIAGLYFIHYLIMLRTNWIFSILSMAFLEGGTSYFICRAEMKDSIEPTEREVNRDEVDTVDGKAQAISADGSRSDPDGDPEKPRTEEHSGRYEWGNGKPID